MTPYITPFGTVWDLDGTLVDTETNHFAAWRGLLEEHGRDLTHQQFQPTFGLRNDDILTSHFGFDATTYSVGEMSERKEELYRASLLIDGIQMQRGARELLNHLQALGVPQAIASSAPPANIELTLRLLDLESAFAAIVSSEEVRHGKPAPDIILRAAERLNLPSSRVVVLEDAPAGIAAGKAASAHVIAIAATFPIELLAEADLIVPSFEEVVWSEAQWEAFLAS